MLIFAAWMGVARLLACAVLLCCSWNLIAPHQHHHTWRSPFLELFECVEEILPSYWQMLFPIADEKQVHRDCHLGQLRALKMLC